MSNAPNLPPWLTQGGTVALGVLLTFHVVYDALASSYANPTLSLGLLGAFCTALGFHRAIRGGGDQ